MFETFRGYKVAIHEAGYTKIVGYFAGNIDGYFILEEAKIQGTKLTVSTPFVAVNDTYIRHISVVSKDKKKVNVYNNLNDLVAGKDIFVQLTCGDRITGKALKSDETVLVLKSCQLITVKLSKKKLIEVKYDYPLMVIPHFNIAHFNALIGGDDVG